MTGPRVLTVDIETSPNIAHVWGLWQQNVSLNQLIETTQVICWAAKWHGEKRVLFASDHHDGHDAQIEKIHALFDEADAVVTYNGDKFDLPHLRREFLLAGLNPPSPVVSIDLCRIVKKHFLFPSHKLQHVSTRLGLPGKVQHTGHDLWVQCMAGDDKAWALMRKYNKQDVVLTEQLYDRVKPWGPMSLNMNLFDGKGCPHCGSGNIQKRGPVRTKLAVYQRYACTDCGGWSRGKHAQSTADERGIQ